MLTHSGNVNYLDVAKSECECPYWVGSRCRARRSDANPISPQGEG
jgi:hypothetical protein